MPTRLIREGILTSERVASLSWEAEVFYRRLMSVADDYGLYDARPAILRSALYPLQLEKMSECNIQRCLAACEAAGLILLFARNGKSFLQIRDFGQQIKSKPKYPLPDDTDLINPSRNDTELHNPLRTVTNRNESLPPVTKSETNTESYTNTKTNADKKEEAEAEGQYTVVKEPTRPEKAPTPEFPGFDASPKPYARGHRLPLPKDHEEVKAWLEAESARGTVSLLPSQIDECALCFWGEMSGCGWIDSKGRPVNNWHGTALAWAVRWEKNSLKDDAAKKKSGGVRMDNEDLIEDILSRRQ